MPLVKPPLAAVSAGQPVTAQGWNAILSAVGALYDGVNALGTEEVVVNVTSGGQPIPDAIVVAVPASGPPVTAVPPHGGDTSYRLTELVVGSYTVHVAARGQAPVAPIPITVPRGPLDIALTATAVAMPNVIGMTAAQAVAALASARIVIDLMLDVFGETVAHGSLPVNQQSSKVLFQQPQAGTPVDPAGRARLVISAVPEVQQSVQVPPIMGLTFEEARRLLNDAGLEVGRVMSRPIRTFTP
ncbi:MAG TPA: PASTA domain-containing protein [Kofleriaceae bacterium]|nr:PASTA domain-containing protein [Kofleriaceae bacterium]